MEEVFSTIARHPWVSVFLAVIALSALGMVCNTIIILAEVSLKKQGISTIGDLNKKV